MGEIYVTYVDDKQVDKHDYDENTDDAHDRNNDIYGQILTIYRWSIDDREWWSMMYRWYIDDIAMLTQCYRVFF